MPRAIANIKKPRGRPRVDAKAIGLRVPPAQLARLDDWIARQPAPKPTRPEAIRRLMEAGLQSPDGTPKPDPTGGKQPQVQGKGLARTTLGRSSSREAADQDAEPGSPKPARPRKPAPRAKAAAMSKEAQIRALRERDTQ
jgi:hypothetical protein